MPHRIEDVDNEEEEEEDYDENADEDFDPENAGGDEDASASSSSEDEETEAKSKKPKKTAGKKRKSVQIATTATTDELDSGDEATIQEQQRKKKRRRKGKDKEEAEDSDGETGGLIKTRAQRLAEKVERKQRRRAGEGEVTVDVEQLWADLSNLPVGRQSTTPNDTAAMVMDEDGDEGEEEMITITRPITYAGETTTIEESVPRSSKQAQEYLASQPPPPPAETTSLNRPLKRPSLFEPNPTALVKGVPPEKLRPRTPSRLDVQMAEKRQEEEKARKAERMTTVQKSALDWKGFVAKQAGLREELDEYGKSKKGYLAREDFLGRVEVARGVQAREARLKG